MPKLEHSAVGGGIAGHGFLEGRTWGGVKNITNLPALQQISQFEEQVKFALERNILLCINQGVNCQERAAERGPISETTDNNVASLNKVKYLM